jgi:hypothetical protein
MRKLALSSCLILGTAAFSTTAVARHAHHRILSAEARAPAAESLTTVGLPHAGTIAAGCASLSARRRSRRAPVTSSSGVSQPRMPPER